MDPKGTIIAALVASAGVLTWKGVSTGTLTPRTYAALIVVTMMLLVLGSFAAELAAAFAILVLVSVLLASPGDIESLGRLAVRPGRG